MFTVRFTFFFGALVQIAGIIYFMNGFIPLSPSILKNEEDTMAQEELSSDTVSLDRFVLMVVDGLRADTVIYSIAATVPPNAPSMPFLMNKSHEGAVACHALSVQPPTVTLPKIKSMMTGATAQFGDILHNFNSPELTQDNILSRLKHSRPRSSQWPLHFCGDDTWLRLFPPESGVFSLTSEGVSSFFVHDYDEVDVNVTRCWKATVSENHNVPWRGLVLHYLGLDHIGHVEGPKGASMVRKVREIDSVVQSLYQLLSKNADERWVIILTSDHGTHDQGGHGGASSGETWVPLLALMSPSLVAQHSDASKTQWQPSCYTRLQFAEQIDLAVNLAGLSQTGIPTGSAGSVWPSLLPLMGSTPSHQAHTIFRNVRHLHRLIQQRFAPPTNVEKIYRTTEADYLNHRQTCPLKDALSFSQIGNSSCARQAVSVLHDLQQVEAEMKAFLSKRQKQTDEPCMIWGLLLLVASCLVWIRLVSRSSDREWRVINEMTASLRLRWRRVLLFGIVVGVLLGVGHGTGCVLLSAAGSNTALCQFGSSVLSWCVAPVGALLCALVYLVGNWLENVCATLQVHTKNVSRTACFLLFGTVLHSVSLGSSSCVEEEHQTWLYLCASLHVVLICDLWYHCCYRMDFLAPVSRTLTGCLKDSQPPLMPMLGLLAVACVDRITRTFNQTGDKWKHLEDVGDVLMRPEHRVVLLGSVLIAYLVIACLLLCDEDSTRFFWPSTCLVVVWQLIYRNLLDSNVTHTTVVLFNYAFLALDLVCNLVLLRRSANTNPTARPLHLTGCILRCLFGLFLLLAKPVNIIVWALILMKERLVFYSFSFLCDPFHRHVPLALALVYVWYGQATFFMQGHSNNLASVDVTAAFVGLSSYHPVISGLLLALNTFSGPLFWWVAFVYRFLFHMAPVWRVKALFAWCAVQSLSMAVFAAVCLHLRHHLFVWTVFAPKFLFLSVHTLLLMFWVLLVVCVVMPKENAVTGGWPGKTVINNQRKEKDGEEEQW